MSNNANYLFENFVNKINQTLDKYAPEVLNQSVNCQTKIVKCGYAVKENFEVKIIVKKIFSNSELLKFCQLEWYERCKVNFYILLFSWRHFSLLSLKESKKH